MIAKVCLVGPQGVGKISIAAKLDGATISSQINDAVTTFASCNVLVGQKSVNLQISVISGKDKLRCMAPIYNKAALAALCVYDLTSEETFQCLRPWVKSIQNNASDECLFIIIGNKLDIQSRQVSEKRARQYAESVGAKYFEVSALSGQGLLNLMIYLAKHLMRWNDCYLTYAAKRSITSNCFEYRAPQEKRPISGRFSFPLRKQKQTQLNVEHISSSLFK